MTRASIILPVSQGAWDEIAAAVTQRGQGDRVDRERRLVDLSDVAVQPEQDKNR